MGHERMGGLVPLFGIVMLFAAPPPEAGDIIQRSVAANRADWNAAPQYSYSETDRQGNTTRTYEVTMILGSPYHRLVARNDEPLSSAEQAKEEQSMEGETARRRAESGAARASRIAEYEKQRKRDQLLMGQLAEAFDFKWAGRQTLDGYDTYVLKATPKRGYRPPGMEAEVLTGMRGTLWIDAASFQWVRVEAQVVRPVFIAGFLARVEPGTSFELEKAPVADGIWLPKHFVMKSRAKILFLVSRREEADETYFDYRKTGSALAVSRP